MRYATHYARPMPHWRTPIRYDSNPLLHSGAWASALQHNKCTSHYYMAGP